MLNKNETLTLVKKVLTQYNNTITSKINSHNSTIASSSQNGHMSSTQASKLDTLEAKDIMFTNPTFTGTVTVPPIDSSSSDTQAANKKYVDNKSEVVIGTEANVIDNTKILVDISEDSASAFDSINYQTRSDINLDTTNKNVVGAINEVNSKCVEVKDKLYGSKIFEYIHTGNKEIYFTSIDWATGIATTTQPHGITAKTEIMIVPNDWTFKNRTNNVMAVPIEWTKASTRITVNRVDDNTLKITQNDGTTIIFVNTTIIGNTYIDATKFHFEIPVGWNLDNISINTTRFEMITQGYVKACGQYRYKRMFVLNEDDTVTECAYFGGLGSPAPSNSGATHCVYGNEVHKIYLDNGNYILEYNNIFEGRRDGYSSLVWDSSIEHSKQINASNSDKNVKSIKRLLTYADSYAYVSNRTKICIYDLGKSVTTEDKYVHPSNHSPSIILQDSNNRFVSDAEKNTWNAKSNFSGSYNDLTNKPTIPTVTNDLTSTLKTNYDTAYTHSQTSHAPSTAQKNSDITKTEIEAKLIGNITSHTHTADHTHSNKTILDGLNFTFWSGTLAQYNEIITKSNTTIYFITG